MRSPALISMFCGRGRSGEKACQAPAPHALPRPTVGAQLVLPALPPHLNIAHSLLVTSVRLYIAKTAWHFHSEQWLNVALHRFGGRRGKAHPSAMPSCWSEPPAISKPRFYILACMCYASYSQ